MRNQIPNFPRHPFHIFEQEVLNALGIKIARRNERLENDQIHIECSCENVEWAARDGQAAAHTPPPTGFVEALNRIGDGITRRDQVIYQAHAEANKTIIKILGPEVENAIYRPRFEAALKFIEEQNTLAWENLALATTSEVADFNKAKLKDGKALSALRARVHSQVARGQVTYKQAIAEVEVRLKADLDAAKRAGQTKLKPNTRAAQALIEADRGAQALEQVFPNKVPSAEKAAYQLVDASADTLITRGRIGKAISIGILLVQVGLAAEDASKAEEFEKALLENLSALALGIALGAALAAATIAVFGATAFLTVVAIGVGAAIIGDLAAAYIVDEVVAAIE